MPSAPQHFNSKDEMAGDLSRVIKDERLAFATKLGCWST